LKLKWGDFLIFFIIASAVVLMLVLSVPKNESGDVKALVSQDGKILYEIDLNAVEGQKEYLVDGGDVIIIAETGKIRFLESDCPNQICVFTGWIHRTNQIAACLPNRVLIKIVGAQDEVDVVLQ